MIRNELLKNNKYITSDPEGSVQTRGINTRQNDMLALYYLSTLFLGKGNPYNVEDDDFVAVFKREKNVFPYSTKRDMYLDYLIGKNRVGIYPNWKACEKLRPFEGSSVVETVYNIVSKLVLDDVSNLETVQQDSSFDFLMDFYSGENNRTYIKVEEILKDIYEISVSNKTDFAKMQAAQIIVDTLETYFNDLDLRAQKTNREYKNHREALQSQQG